MRPLLAVLAILLLGTVLVADALAEHRPGCNTDRCDRHIGRYLSWWAFMHPTSEAVASWYDDEEATACGVHYRYGLASLTLACGTAVRLCFDGCVTARVEDRGPYVTGRLFDLNPGARDAISCTDLCGAEGGTLTWAVAHDA